MSERECHECQRGAWCVKYMADESRFGGDKLRCMRTGRPAPASYLRFLSIMATSMKQDASRRTM